MPAGEAGYTGRACRAVSQSRPVRVHAVFPIPTPAWRDPMMNGLVERNRDAIILAARILLMVLFIMSGLSKLTNFAGTVAYMASLHAPLPTLAAAVSVFMEFFVGAAIVVGLWVRPLALLFVLFTLGTAVMGHAFWSMEGQARDLNTIQFFKNVAICGGLLLLAVTGGGRYALTRSH
ncbi:MAG: DoxX family protein [Stenotrophomonas sp.]